MNFVKYGADVGNYDTKGPNTTTPSSYKKYAVQNMLDDECIFFEGAYYSPTTERNNQQLDKTENDYCIIMTLFTIAKETIFRIKEKDSSLTPEQIQAEIDKITDIKIGFGLPAGHFSSLAEKTSALYNEKFKNGFTFQYRKINNTYEFNLRLVGCAAFPQDYTAVAFNKSLQIPMKFDFYYTVGIGGGTIDIIPVENGSPLVDKVISLSMGTTVCYTEISRAIQHETGKTLDYKAIESVLLGKPTVIDDFRKKRIAEEFAIQVENVIAEMIHQGAKISDYPCVFVGGGALLMKPEIEKSGKFALTEFVEDVRANAVYYETFV